VQFFKGLIPAFSPGSLLVNTEEYFTVTFMPVQLKRT